ncbi:single-stranded DNA-binding protein [Catenuloplanes japonicus]|uniref:single-stranded DNA-binding protein n=1 Tax=Catenuloplanes japonicus TaxID=33876 RepID=UPI000A113296|nr:single-stranded DNA-binding protein [Catenuloplanes japonicus]
MFDTYVTVVGNVLTAPEWRRTESTKAVVAHFKVASTARKMDRETGQWIDGNHLRVRVTCWRRLAENVAACVMTGDPVIVIGRLYTRDWIDPDGNHRVQYELEAVSVGHDLNRGQGTFKRTRPGGAATGEIADGLGDDHIRGEATEPFTPGGLDEQQQHADGDFDYEPPASPLDRPDDPLAGEDLGTALDELDDTAALTGSR